MDRSRRVASALLARPPLVDVLVFLLLALSMIVEFIASRDAVYKGLTTFQKRLSISLLISIVLVMLFRRRVPLSVFLAVASLQFVLLAQTGWHPFTAEWCLYVCTYTVASLKPLRWAVAAVVLATLTWSVLPSQDKCPCMVQLSTFLIFAAIAGFSAQAGRRLMRELQRQAGILRSTREQRLGLALDQERTRVARELHDMVAHAVTVMVVQAGAARMVAATDRLRADNILARVEALAGQALQELRSLRGSLVADSNASDEARPPPSSESIPSLIEHERATGLHVDLEVMGDPQLLDPAMEISLYRIVQEALTNVRKHAPTAEAHVALRYLAPAVEVEIANGPGVPSARSDSLPGFGRGLIGIRERAALFGGEAYAGRTNEGGFRVSARLPLQLVPA